MSSQLLWTPWMTDEIAKRKKERNRLDTYCSTIYFASNSDGPIQIGSLSGYFGALRRNQRGCSGGWLLVTKKPRCVNRQTTVERARYVKMHIYRSRHCVSILNFHLFLWSVVVKVCRIDKIRLKDCAAISAFLGDAKGIPCLCSRCGMHFPWGLKKHAARVNKNCFVQKKTIWLEIGGNEDYRFRQLEDFLCCDW